MRIRRPMMPLLPLLALSLAACAAPPTGGDMDATRPTQPSPGFVTDMPAFDAFIASRPTPAQFGARYPDVALVLPGMIATKEFRTNNSRYFAELDGAGRITSGRFQ